MNKNSYKLSIFLVGIFSVIIFGSYQLLSKTYAAPFVEPSSKATGIEKSAYFAGGCFWCTESDFEKVEGVLEAVSGYTGGHVPDPTYQQVSSGGTGHVETVRVIYDPAEISYERLLDVFWRHVDPTDGGGQFVDRGSQYRSVIFYSNDMERKMAEDTKARLEGSGKFIEPIATDILPIGVFYPAEEYHQNYYKRNSLRYRFYRSRSGRDQFLKETWPNPAGMSRETEMPGNMNKPRIKKGGEVREYDDAALRERLTPLQYRVVRENGTEPPFNNAYWDSHESGIFVDVVSGEPLFSSSDKFKSGTGWPSFIRPLEPGNIVEKEDREFFMVRTEVRSKTGDSHLGHLFNDGPAPTGLRYCINSAALQFVPRDDLEKEGYGQYLSLFR